MPAPDGAQHPEFLKPPTSPPKSQHVQGVIKTAHSPIENFDVANKSSIKSRGARSIHKVESSPAPISLTAHASINSLCATGFEKQREVMK